MGNLPSQSSTPCSSMDAPQLMNIPGFPGAQIIATSQGSFLQHGNILGSNLVQVIQNPITVISSGTSVSPSSESSISATNPANNLTAVAGTPAPLTVLLQHHQLQQQQPQHQLQGQQGGQQQQQIPSDGSVLPIRWADLKSKMHYPLSINCGRPFCKLKKKDHYHCLDCYQAFSDPARLRVHLGKHNFKFKKPHFKIKSEDQIVTKILKLDQSLGQGKELPLQSSDPQAKIQKHDGFQKSNTSSSGSTNFLYASEEMFKSEDEDNHSLSSSLNLCPSVFTEMVGKSTDAVKIGKASTQNLSSQLRSRSNSPSEKITLVMSNVNSKWTIGKNSNESKKDAVILDSNKKQPSTALTALTRSKAKREDIIHPNERMEDSTVQMNCHSTIDEATNYDSDVPVLMVDEGHHDDDESNDSSSLNASSSSSLTLCSSLSRNNRRRRPSVRNKDYINSETALDEADLGPTPPKQRRKYRKNFVVPEGFSHFRSSEDCGFSRCAYRQSVTHFHCLRANCGYGISDRSRIMQHQMRHERLDILMGGEFAHYRASVSCKRDGCENDERSSSHFHCLKCSYTCTDSGRVPAHRKHHAKLDNVSSNGFIKYMGVQDCQTSTCYYFRKQTHYHCTFPGCNHAVLGPSQMAPHKLKHI